VGVKDRQMISLHFLDHFRGFLQQIIIREMEKSVEKERRSTQEKDVEAELTTSHLRPVGGGH
jgi:hypothetical protein